MDPDRNLHQGNIKLGHVIMHEGRGGFYGHTVNTGSRNREFFYTIEITPKLKRIPEEASIIQRGRQLKLNVDNKVNTNVFASISFQENDKVFPKVERAGGRL